jgi:hypothetical protein
MADTYGVTVTEVAEELPGLFPVGFSPATAPSAAQVASFISTGDTLVTLRVKDATGGVPSASDAAAPLAKRYVINWVLAQVVKIVYAGNDPARVAEAAKAYTDVATELGAAIDLLGEQAIGAGDSAPRVFAGPSLPERDLMITNADLDGDPTFRARRF